MDEPIGYPWAERALKAAQVDGHHDRLKRPRIGLFCDHPAQIPPRTTDLHCASYPAHIPGSEVPNLRLLVRVGECEVINPAVFLWPKSVFNIPLQLSQRTHNMPMSCSELGLLEGRPPTHCFETPEVRKRSGTT